MSSPIEHKTFSKWEKKEKKDYHKGYQVFEPDSTPEKEEITSPKPSKSRTKPSFKLAKKEKVVNKVIEKEAKKEKEKSEKKKDRKKLHRKKQQLAYSSQSAELPQRPVFGVPLELAVQRSKSHDGLQLPAFFREFVDHVEAHGLSTEGIYRISPVKSKVQNLVHAINMGRPVDLSEHDCCVIGGVIKLFLRELPEPVLTHALGASFEEASALRDPQAKLRAFKQLLDLLPVPNRLLLAWMMIHATHVISRAGENKMSLQNVSIVLSPTMQISHRVLHIFLTYHNDLFSDIKYQRYVPPLRPSSDGARVELPDTAPAVEEELAKQESLLATLHEEIKEGDTNAEKEAQIWEVQRLCTQLKRKRFLLVRLVSREAIEAELVKQEAQLARLHAQAERADGPDHDTDEQLWEVQRTVTLLKRKLKVSQRGAPPAQQAAETKEEDEVMLNLTLRKVDRMEEMEKKASVERVEVKAAVLKESEKPREAAVDAPALEEWRAKAIEAEKAEEAAAAAAAAAAAVAVAVDVDVGAVVTDVERQGEDHESEEKAKVVEDSAEVTVPPRTEVSQDQEVISKEEAPEAISKEEAPETISREEAPETISREEAPETISREEAPETDEEEEEEGSGPPRVSDSSGRSSSSAVAHSSVVDEEEAESQRKPIDVVLTQTSATTPRSLPGPMISLDDFIERGFLAAGESDLLLGDEDEDEELRSAVDDYRRLRFEEEELCAIGNDLRTRIESEKREIARLKQEIARLKTEAGGNEGSSGGDLSSDEYDSSDEEATEEELVKQYHQLVHENERLARENKTQVENIQRERMLCAEIKVQLRMMTSSILP